MSDMWTQPTDSPYCRQITVVYITFVPRGTQYVTVLWSPCGGTRSYTQHPAGVSSAWTLYVHTCKLLRKWREQGPSNENAFDTRVSLCWESQLNGRRTCFWFYYCCNTLFILSCNWLGAFQTIQCISVGSRRPWHSTAWVTAAGAV